MKKITIFSLILVFCSPIIINALFKPFIAKPVLDKNMIPGFRTVERFNSFTLIKEEESVYCYALVEIYTDKKGLHSVILKSKVTDSTNASEWKIINPPIDNTGKSNLPVFKYFVNSKETNYTKPLVISKIDSQVALAGRAESSQSADIFLYDYKKNAWTHYSSLPNETSSYNVAFITGSKTASWIKTCNWTKQDCIILELTKNIDSIAIEKTSYTNASVTPDNQYAWLINPAAISIKDLTDEEAFTQEINVPRNMPQIINFVAVNDETAFFIGLIQQKINTYMGLYKLALINDSDEDLNIKITEIKNLPGKITATNPLGMYDGKLVIGFKDTLYIHEEEPQISKNLKLTAPQRRITHTKKAITVHSPMDLSLPRLPEFQTTENVTIQEAAKKITPSKTLNEAVRKTERISKKIEVTESQAEKDQSIIKPTEKQSTYSDIRNTLATIVARMYKGSQLTKPAIQERRQNTSLLQQQKPTESENIATKPTYFQRLNNWLNTITGNLFGKKSEITQATESPKSRIISAPSLEPREQTNNISLKKMQGLRGK